MFEKFTDKARKVMSLAQEEARSISANQTVSNLLFIRHYFVDSTAIDVTTARPLSERKTNTSEVPAASGELISI